MNSKDFLEKHRSQLFKFLKMVRDGDPPTQSRSDVKTLDQILEDLRDVDDDAPVYRTNNLDDYF